jgi:hypothetical protein
LEKLCADFGGHVGIDTDFKGFQGKFEIEKVGVVLADLTVKNIILSDLFRKV